MRARGPLYFGDNTQQQYSIHPQHDVVSCRYYSCDNVRRIQDLCESRGWGRPEPVNLRLFMDYVLAYDRGQYSRDMMTKQQFEQFVTDYVETMNQRVLGMIQPYIGPARLKYEQHQRRLMGMRALPPNPQMSCPSNRKDLELQFPYYNHLE